MIISCHFFSKTKYDFLLSEIIVYSNTFYQKHTGAMFTITFFNNVNTQGNNSTGNVISNKQTVVVGYFLNH